MSARRFALLAGLAFFILFIALNVTANSWLRSWRLDLTENRLYTLSDGAKRTLDAMTEPVELRLFYSRDAAAPAPSLQAYAARVREMMQSFAARSRGRVRFVEVNVKPFSDEEDAAVEAGIEAIRLYEGADPIYFGLAGANAIDDTRVIPAFDPQREAFLEYEITRLIFELENPERTRVALITSLPLDPGTAGQGPAPSGQSAFATELGRLMDVEKLPGDFTDIPDVDVLAIIHPGALSQAQLFAIDQFVLRTGRAFVALDPASLAAEQAGQSLDPFAAMMSATAPAASTLEPLLARWGVAMTPGVVLDLEGALPVRIQDENGQPASAPQPLFFAVPAAQLNREDLMTAWLRQGVNFGLAGALSWTDREAEGVRVEPLARTSGRTMRMSGAEALARPSPIDILSNWPQTGGRIETIALRLSGNLQTAFPEGAPAGAPPAEAQTAPAPLAQSARAAEIVIVADADFLSDDFYLSQGGAPAADNAAFALNAIDVLGGSDALVSLRSRAPSARPMKVIDDMEMEARQSIAERQRQLEAELSATESQLAALQSRGRGSGFFTGNLGAELTPEENAAIERFRQRVVEVRGELRGVERALRGDIERLKALVLFINVWMGPLLISAVGLFLFWRRQRRGKAR